MISSNSEGRDLNHYWSVISGLIFSGKIWEGNVRGDRDQTYVWRLWDFIPGSHKNEFEVIYDPTNAVHPEIMDLVHLLKFKARKVVY